MKSLLLIPEAVFLPYLILMILGIWSIFFFKQWKSNSTILFLLLFTGGALAWRSVSDLVSGRYWAALIIFSLLFGGIFYQNSLKFFDFWNTKNKNCIILKRIIIVVVFLSVPLICSMKLLRYNRYGCFIINSAAAITLEDSGAPGGIVLDSVGERARLQYYTKLPVVNFENLQISPDDFSEKIFPYLYGNHCFYWTTDKEIEEIEKCLSGFEHKLIANEFVNNRKKRSIKTVKINSPLCSIESSILPDSHNATSKNLMQNGNFENACSPEIQRKLLARFANSSNSFWTNQDFLLPEKWSFSHQYPEGRVIEIGLDPQNAISGKNSLRMKSNVPVRFINNQQIRMDQPLELLFTCRGNQQNLFAIEFRYYDDKNQISQTKEFFFYLRNADINHYRLPIVKPDNSSYVGVGIVMYEGECYFDDMQIRHLTQKAK